MEGLTLQAANVVSYDGCIAQLVRALGLHPGGQGFESLCAHYLRGNSTSFFPRAQSCT